MQWNCIVLDIRVCLPFQLSYLSEQMAMTKERMREFIKK